MLAWVDWTNSQHGSSIVTALSDAQQLEISENRHYISVVVETVKFLSKQDLAFRGHKETMSDNKGTCLCL